MPAALPDSGKPNVSNSSHMGGCYKRLHPKMLPVGIRYNHSLLQTLQDFPASDSAQLCQAGLLPQGESGEVAQMKDRLNFKAD